MDDLISRQAAIDALGEKPLAWTKGEYEQGLQDQWERDVDALIELPSLQPREDIRAICGECDAWNQYKNYPQPGWIPCSERLPEAGEYYLVTRQYFGWNGEEYKEIDIAKYEVDGWEWCGNNSTVVAWRELPDPWKGERA